MCPDRWSEIAMIGQDIGPYRIVGKLGAGGMGEVYRAHDARLGRDVAIKVLPPGLTADPDRLARFEREARVLASLNHPHIGMLHGLEESGPAMGSGHAARALVLELVEGDTLAERIACGPMPIKQALTWARQIADALDAAHDKGVVHRDLKPANIKITPNDVVKVLDFGLARTYASGSESDELTHSPTITSDGGAILGTAAYMSPEQTRGQPVSKRADIWAFGCVFYEMLTGRRAFAGPTVSDTLAAVLQNEPDWTALPSALPTSVHSLLQRCLEKDVRQRRRDIGDVRAELDDAIARPVSGTRDETRTRFTSSRHRLKKWWWIAAAVVIGVATLATFLTLPAAPEAEAGFRRITDSIDMEESPALSPSGNEIAFVRAIDGRRQIWVHRDGGGEARQITFDEADHDDPRWMSDSNNILYFTSASSGQPGSISRIPTSGNGTAQLVAPSLTGGDVSFDDRIAAFRKTDGETVLAILDRSGHTIRTINVPRGITHLMPRWSPDGRFIAMLISGAGKPTEMTVHVADVASGKVGPQIARAIRMGGLTWLRDGSGLVYASSKGSAVAYPPVFQLRVVSRDGKRDRQLVAGEDSFMHPDIGQSGRLVVSRLQSISDIWRYPIAGGPEENVTNGKRITTQTSHIQTPTASPDGTEVAYLSDSGGYSNLWVTSTDGLRRRQLTFEQDRDTVVGVPVWSPKENKIAFVKFDRLGGSSEWIVEARRPDSPRLVADGATWAAWSSDGKWLYYVLRNGTASDIYKKAIDDGSPQELVKSNATIPVLSPDSRTLYYSAGVGGIATRIFKSTPESAEGVYLQEYDSSRIPPYPSGRVLSPNGDWLAMPLKDGGTTNIWLISTADGRYRQVTEFGRRATVITRQVSWSPDSKMIYAAVQEINADIVLIDGIDTGVRRAR